MGLQFQSGCGVLDDKHIGAALRLTLVLQTHASVENIKFSP